MDDSCLGGRGKRPQFASMWERAGFGQQLGSTSPTTIYGILTRGTWVRAALPWLSLNGISTGDMGEALCVLLGEACQRPVGQRGEPVQGAVDRSACDLESGKSVEVTRVGVRALALKE